MDIHSSLQAKRDGITTQIESLVGEAADGDRELTDDELQVAQQLEGDLKGVDQQIAILARTHEAKAKAATKLANIAATPKTLLAAGEGVIRKQEPMYRQGGPHRFLDDWVLSRSGGPNRDVVEAKERIESYRAESVEYDTTLASYPGLVPPTYLLDEALPHLRAGRPTANICNMRSLPDSGDTIKVNLITTGSTALPAAELGTSSETDIVSTAVTLNVETVRGAVDVSFEGIMRGVHVHEAIVADLAAAVNTKVNDQVINGSGTSPNVQGILAGMLAANLKSNDDAANGKPVDNYVELVKLIGVLAQKRYQVPTHLIIHPRRLSNLMTAMDSDNRPLFGANTATTRNPIVQGQPSYGMASMDIAGIPVFSDASIPTNLDASDTDEDVGLAVYAPDLWLYESPFMVMEGDPQLAKWTHTISVGKFIAFKMVRDVSAAGVHGQRWT